MLIVCAVAVGADYDCMGQCLTSCSCDLPSPILVASPNSDGPWWQGMRPPPHSFPSFPCPQLLKIARPLFCAW